MTGLPLVKAEQVDGYLQVSDEDAIQAARKAARTEGIFAGFSSGANLAAAAQLLCGELRRHVRPRRETGKNALGPRQPAGRLDGFLVRHLQVTVDVLRLEQGQAGHGVAAALDGGWAG